MKRSAVVLILFAQLAWPEAARLELPPGKSRVIETPEGVERVAIGSGDVAEAVAVSPTEVLVHARGTGSTSLFIWRRGGGRDEYEVRVAPAAHRFDAVRAVLESETGNRIRLETQDGVLFLRGTATDTRQAERAATIAGTLGSVVNLLQVDAPGTPAQVLLKIRFADMDRTASTELGANLFSTGAARTPGAISTQQFTPPAMKSSSAAGTEFTISDALNILLFRPDINLGATIKALQSRNLLQILAEPNLLAIDGKEASFLAGGEFPYPVVQGGGVGLTTVTIQFRQFGIKINFTPTVTSRGSIHLRVAPEVSSLDYANGLTYQGFAVPGLSVRRVQTEVELENEQSFAIAGLIDNRVAEGLSKVPGLGDIPLFGRLFQSRSTSRNKTELLVVVTPQLVTPIPAGEPAPSLPAAREWMKEGVLMLPKNPASAKPLPVKRMIPIEELAPPAPMVQRAPKPEAGAKK